MTDISLDRAIEKDRACALGHMRSKFHVPEDIIYLDGNSLGPLGHHVAEHVSKAITNGWGEGLIRSWNDAGWIVLPQKIGAQIAPLIGAQKANVIMTDSTSVNLFKVLSVALGLNPARRKIVTETYNFPTDIYIAEGVINQISDGHELVGYDDVDDIIAELDDSVAVVMLSHINYRSGRMSDMAKMTKAAHDVGAFIIWDLAHSAGAIPVELAQCDVDFAVGCSYKYLNGGPGAPAFVYVAQRHLGTMPQPLCGWFAHRAPFDFMPHYEPATDITQYLCGTPPVLSALALEAALEVWEGVDMQMVREKSLGLTDYFIALMTARCDGYGLSLISPHEHDRRGSHLAYTHPTFGYAMISALAARGVIGDFRAPDILRFGFAPLYNCYEDVWHAVDRLADILKTRSWDKPQFHARKIVT